MPFMVQITFDPSNGSLGVGSNDPKILGDRILCLGLLEMTKLALQEQWKQSENRVQPVSMMPPGFPQN